MKKQTLVQLLSVAVVICLLVVVTSAATPNGEMIQPRLSKLTSLNATLDIDASGRATCYSSARDSDRTDSVSLYMELQRSSNGSSWTTVKSWSTTGSSFVSLTQSWYVNTSGYSYRVVATASVYNSAGTFVESVTATSAVV